MTTVWKVSVYITALSPPEKRNSRISIGSCPTHLPTGQTERALAQSETNLRHECGNIGLYANELKLTK